MAIGDSQKVEGLPGLEGINLGDWFDEQRKEAASERAAAATRRSVSIEETGAGYLPGLEDMVRFPGEGIDRYDPLKRLLRQETSDLGETREEGLRTMYWPAGYRPSVEEARQMDAQGFLRESVDPLTGKKGRTYYPADKDVIDQAIATPWTKLHAASYGMPAGRLFGMVVPVGMLEPIAQEFARWTRTGLEGPFRQIFDDDEYRAALAEKAKANGLSFYELTQDVRNKHLIKEVLDENFKLPPGVAGAMEGLGYAAVPLTAGEALILKGGVTVLKGGYKVGSAGYHLLDPNAAYRGLVDKIPSIPLFPNRISDTVTETRSRGLQVHDVTDPEAIPRILEEGGRPDEFVHSFEVWTSEGEPLLLVTAQKTSHEEPVFELVGGSYREVQKGLGDATVGDDKLYDISVQALKRFTKDTPEGGSGLSGAGFYDLAMKGSFTRKEILEVAEVVAERLDADVLHGLRLPDDIPVGMERFGAAAGEEVAEAVETPMKGIRFQNMKVSNLKKLLDRNSPADPQTAELVSQGRIKLFDDAYNPFIEGVEGIADGALRWNDVSFWYRMSGDVDIRSFRNGLDGGGRKILTEVFKRLEAMKLVGEVRPGVYRRLVENGSVEANKILGDVATYHTGVISGGSGTARRWVGELGGFQEAFDRVASVENGVLRAFLTRSGINPSVGALNPLEKAVIAFVRQANVSEELAEVAIQAAYDSHRVRWQPFFGRGPGLSLGRSPISLDGDGMIDAVYRVGDAAELGAITSGKVHWNDVFSNPDAYGAAFAPGTPARNLIDDFQEVIREIEAYRIKSGLAPRPKQKKGFIYIPRIGIGSRGKEFVKPTNPYEARIWETATEGAVEGSVRYEADPRAVLELHLKSAYHDVLMKQMEGFVIHNNLGVTYDAALRDVVPEVMARFKQRYAIWKSMDDDLTRMRTRNHALAAEVGDDAPQVQAAARQIAEQVKRVQEARVLYEKVYNERGAALNNIKGGERVRASLFSGGEPGMVSVSEFMGIFMRRGEEKRLQDGIKHLLGPTAQPIRFFNQLAGTVKYTSATLDLAAPFTHGLTMIGTNPIRWAKAAMNSTWALLDPTVQSHYIRDNLNIIQRMARYGVPVGDVEYFVASQSGGGIAWGAPLGKVKLGPINGETLRSLARGATGQTLGRFQASYNADVLMMRTELWKALEPHWHSKRQNGGYADLASHISNVTGGIDIKALGVGPNQRAIEGLFMAFAPRLMRSIGVIFADAFRAIPSEAGFRLGLKEEGATAKQRQTFQSVANLLTFMHGFSGTLWIANELAKGREDPNYTIAWEKGAKEFFNPLSGRRYMSIERDGEWYGIGGQSRGMLQLMTGLIMALNPLDDSDKSLVSWDSQKNPILQRWVTLGAPGLDFVSASLEAATGADLIPGENIEGVTDVITHTISNAMMFAIQGFLEGDNATGVAGSSIGFSTKPTTPFENATLLRRDVFQRMTLEEKSQFADAEGGFLRVWPGTTHGDAWENMDLRLRDYIDAQDPRIEAFLDEHRGRRLEAGDRNQEYFSEREGIVEDRNDALDALEKKYGVGKSYRLGMASIYADTKGRMRQLDLDFDDVVDGMEVTERKEEAAYNKAELKFWDAMASPDLVDPDTGEYLYSVDRRIREELKLDPAVGPYLDEIEKRLVTMHPDGVRDFWNDMDRMKDYFVMGETVAERHGLLDEYRVWLRESKDNRRVLERRDFHLADLVSQGGVIQQAKQRMRMGADPSIDWSAEDSLRLEAALLKWEYVEKPMNFRLEMLWIDLKASQGHWVHRREYIDELVEQHFANERQAELVAP